MSEFNKTLDELWKEAGEKPFLAETDCSDARYIVGKMRNGCFIDDEAISWTSNERMWRLAPAAPKAPREEMTDETKKAVDRLCKALRSDPGYWETWKSNIAMAFKDQAQWSGAAWDYERLHEVANKAAEHFLKVLTMDRVVVPASVQVTREMLEKAFEGMGMPVVGNSQLIDRLASALGLEDPKR